MREWLIRNKFILAATLLLCALIWPVGIFRAETISRTAADYSKNTDPIGLVAAIEEFVPQYDEIKTLGIDIGKQGGKADSGNIRLTIYDENLQEILAVNYPVADMKDGELTDIPVDAKLTAGKRYFFGVQCEDYDESAPVLHYRDETRNACPEHLHFYYGPVVQEGAVANMRFTYAVRLKWWQILFYDSFIIFAVIAVSKLLEKKDEVG
ncbi:MAG: hypothetical protein K5641_03935 [Lachnospiraceae bacterium]|nr:hypothetical protein [Lachnospiraceae bacterium]